MPGSFYFLYGKRIFDLTASLLGLLILSPLLLVIAAFIKLSDNGPVFFRQRRVGQNFTPLELIKFRSMVVNADRIGSLVTTGGDPRITGIGRFLRKTKLDELPQLINVLRGEISLVGPRPEVLKYVQMFRDEYKEILTFKPGITDYAAIEFSNEEGILRRYSDPEEGYVRDVLPRKIELYKKYTEDIGLRTDMRLILVTLSRICLRGEKNERA